MNQYDLIVIGAGPGGYVAAIRAAQLGMKVAVVERNTVGGTCLNRGCIPTKALLHAGEVLEEMRNASKLGLSCENVSYDIQAVYKRRDDIVKKLRGGVEMLFKGNGIDLYRGHGSFVDKNTVCVSSESGEENISAKYIIIAVGSEVRNPHFPGLELAMDSDDILEKLPDGMDTVIGTKGVYLSGGEQQRIAIARVMLKNTPIIILDEATAFADPDNETRVQAAFSKLSQGKTVIMIAHRLSTVAGADRIYVVKDGQIAESGSSRELMERGGLFARMWQNYQTSVQWKVQKEVR